MGLTEWWPELISISVLTPSPIRFMVVPESLRATIWRVTTVESLEQALMANRDQIERELAKAEAELVTLRRREVQLEGTIARAKLVLGGEPPRRFGGPKDLST